MLSQLRTSVLMLLVFSVLTGLIYPLAITGIAQVVFPQQANGSLITHEGRTAGSRLIGQPFDDPKYFWSRPSATGPVPYNGGSSSGSNLAVTNPAQHEAIRARVEKLRAADPGNTSPIPIDLLTASGSGLDPHISPAAAEFQAARVARVRSLPLDRVRQAIVESTAAPQFGLLGPVRVNVLELNLVLDQRGKGSR